MKTGALTLLYCIIAMGIVAQTDSSQVIKDTLIVNQTKQLTFKDQQPLTLDYSTVAKDYKSTPKTISTSFADFPIELEQKPLDIKPIRYRHHPTKLGNDGFIKVGYGTPRAAEVAALYNYHIENWYNFGAEFGFDAADNQDIANMNYTEFKGKLFAGYHLTENVKVIADGSFRRNEQGLYDITFAADSMTRERVINRTQVNLGLVGSTFEKNGWHWQLNSTLKQAKFVKYDDEKQTGWTTGGVIHRKINETDKLSLRGEYSTTISEFEENVDYFLITPQYSTRGDDWQCRFGVDVAVADKTIAWPNIDGHYTFESIDIPLIVRLQSELRLDNNFLYDMYEQNPFVIAKALYNNTPIKRRNANIDATYSINNHKFILGFNASLLQDAPVFERSVVTPEHIVTYFDEINLYSPSLKANGKLTDWLNYDFGTTYTFASNDNTDLDHYDKWRTQIKLFQSFIKDRLRLEQSFIYLQRYGNATITDNDIADLHVGIHFRVLPKLWLYANGSNLLMQDYFIWEGFPVYKSMVLGGIRYVIK